MSEQTEIEVIRIIGELAEKGLVTIEPNDRNPWDGPLVRVSAAGEAALDAAMRARGMER